MPSDEQMMKKLGAQFFASMATDLRGLAKVDEVAENYVKVFASEGGAEEFKQLAVEQHEAASPYGILEAEDGTYFVNLLLMLSYQDAEGAAEGGVIKAGSELPTSFTTLLEAQKEFDPREVEPNMVGEGSLQNWKLKQPAALALATYFRQNLVAGQTEELVQKVQKNLCQMTTGGYKTTDMVDYLVREGIVVNEKTVIDLLTNFLSEMPRWDTNGWSPDDLSMKEFGYKISNTPRTMGKVGRNDPCPCGSGKKYKKCCGRYAD